jgi:glycosyltransferase 2 family protein
MHVKRNLVRRLVTFGALAVLVAGALCVSGRGAEAVSMLAALGGVQPSTIGVALALSTLAALLSGMLWYGLIRRLGYHVSYQTALQAYLSAGLAGYVVIAVGPALGSAVSLRRHGVSPSRAALLAVIANVLGFCGVLVWTPVGLLLLTRAELDRTLPIVGRQGPLAAVLLVAVLVAAMLLVLQALTSAAGSENQLARRLLGRGPAAADAQHVVMRWRQVLALVPWSAASWMTGTLALYVVLATMNPGTSVSPGAVVGSAVLAAVLGSLAFFVPKGLGVSDSILVALLAQSTGLSPTTCVAAALAMRLLDPLTKLSLLGVLARMGDSLIGGRFGDAGVRARRLGQVTRTTRLPGKPAC